MNWSLVAQGLSHQTPPQAPTPTHLYTLSIYYRLDSSHSPIRPHLHNMLTSGDDGDHEEDLDGYKKMYNNYNSVANCLCEAYKLLHEIMTRVRCRLLFVI